MNTLLLFIEPVANSQFETVTFGQLAGWALFILALGCFVALIFNGWPEFKVKK